MLSPKEVTQEYYLEVRLKLLEIAAIMDRYDRSAGQPGTINTLEDPAWQRCFEAIDVLKNQPDLANRAERIALIFSDS